MRNKLIKASLKTIAKTLHSVAVLNVNTACFVTHGQEKEPKSLKRYKKH